MFSTLIFVCVAILIASPYLIRFMWYPIEKFISYRKQQKAVDKYSKPIAGLCPLPLNDDFSFRCFLPLEKKQIDDRIVVLCPAHGEIDFT